MPDSIPLQRFSSPCQDCGIFYNEISLGAPDPNYDLISGSVTQAVWSGSGKTGHAWVETQGYWVDNTGTKIAGTDLNGTLDTWFTNSQLDACHTLWDHRQVAHSGIAKSTKPANGVYWRYTYHIQSFILNSMTGVHTGVDDFTNNTTNDI